MVCVFFRLMHVSKIIVSCDERTDTLMVILQLEQLVLKVAHAGRLDAEIRFTYIPSNLVELGWLPFNFLG